MHKNRYYYRDLQTLGHGSRNTVAKKVRERKFPQPYADEAGRPFWDDQQLEGHEAELKKTQYRPTPIKHLVGRET